MTLLAIVFIVGMLGQLMTLGKLDTNNRVEKEKS